MLHQPKTYFSLEHLCPFNDCHHSSTARQGVLIESLTRYYLFIFHKHLPLHSSFPSNSVLWGSGFGSVNFWHHSTESYKTWSARMRSNGYLTSHGTLHGMLTLPERWWGQQMLEHTHTHNAIIFNSAKAAAFEQLRHMCWLMHCHWAFWCIFRWLVGISLPKDIPQWTKAKQCQCPSLKTS